MARKATDGPPRPFCSAVILAAGSSERMGDDKLLIELGSMTVISRTLAVFEACGCVDEIIIVTRSEKIPYMADICRAYDISKAKCIVEGGASRSDSSARGVAECSSGAQLIAIHDGARPFVTPQLVERVTKAAAVTGAAVPAVRTRDTVRQVRGGKIVKTLERGEICFMQTPQVFSAELIRGALADLDGLGVQLTDDCAAVLLRDAEVSVVDGLDENIKITTPTDLRLAEAILASRGEWV